MLRKARIALAALFFVGITLLLVGIGQQWWGWMAKLQFLPACLALNLAVIIGIVLITFVFGRIYCSVICPLGVWQDIVIWARRSIGSLQRDLFKRRAQRAKAQGKAVPKPGRFVTKQFGYAPEHKIVRYSVWAVFILCIVLGLQVVVALIAPYSAYGRIVTSIVSPRGWAVPLVAFLTLAAVTYLSWTYGRAWCNTICPVGTTLGLISRFSIFRIGIDSSKCTHCGRCYKGCKSSCIDGEAHKVDGSRCVDCFDCIGVCSGGAVKYRFAYGKSSGNPSSAAPASDESDVNPSASEASEGCDAGRRAFIVGAVMAGTALSLKAQNDGGLAPVIAKKAPKRDERLTPPGSVSARNFYDHCTACQLCVANCPNHVLRPSTDLGHLMQPQMGFEKGFCRPECTVCSQVCPAGAILPLTSEEKTAVHIGKAVVDFSLCIAHEEGVNCGTCASHCPAGAISMVRKDPDDPSSPRIPAIIEDRCIGCGKCEYLCPARPLSAIHIEGLPTHIVK